MGLCSTKRQGSDDEDEEPTTVQQQNTVATSPQLDELELPLLNEVVEHVTSFLGGPNGSFADRVRAAAVCRQLRTAVLGNMRRMGGRYLKISIGTDHIRVKDIRVENDLLPPKDQMECVLALMEFGHPTHLCLANYECQDEELRLIDVRRILSSVSPLSITRLQLHLNIGQFSGETPFNTIMKMVGGMTNLETLHLDCRCEEAPASLAHRNSLPSVPEDSPFLHLLKLERLRGLAFNSPELVSPKQQADLINRSPSTINHLCSALPTFTNNETMLKSMNAVVRANITSACCWGEQLPLPLVLLNNLPNCRSVCCAYSHDDQLPTRQKIDKMARDLLTNCHENDDRRGKTLQLKIAQCCRSNPQTTFSHNVKRTVVGVTVSIFDLINDFDCPIKATIQRHL